MKKHFHILFLLLCISGYGNSQTRVAVLDKDTLHTVGSNLVRQDRMKNFVDSVKSFYATLVNPQFTGVGKIGSDTLATMAYARSVGGAVGDFITSATAASTYQPIGTYATLAGTQTFSNKTLTSPVINSPSGLVKGDVGLGNVDNTSDAGKPVSTAQAAAIGLKGDKSDSTGTTGFTSRGRYKKGLDSVAALIAGAGLSQSAVSGIVRDSLAAANIYFDNNDFYKDGSSGSPLKVKGKADSTTTATALAGKTTLAAVIAYLQGLPGYVNDAAHVLAGNMTWVTASTNAAPVASSVTLVGTPTEGQVLSTTYTYSDAESNTESGTVKKYYSYTNTSGAGSSLLATASTYTLTNAQVGKYIRSSVTPGASAGSTPGTEAFSAYSSAVVANSITNLVTAPDDFTNGAWSKNDLTVSADAGNNSLGAATADKLIPSASSSNKYINQSVATTAGSLYYMSIEFKPSAYKMLKLSAYNASVNEIATVTGDANAGTTTGGSGSITNKGNGWYELKIAFTAGSGSSTYVFLNFLSDAGADAWTGDGTNGFLLGQAKVYLQ